MPTHEQLLDAEVAFILYKGQVYMSHPTDRDVSLPRLVEQVEVLNHLPSNVTLGITDFLRGGPPPEGLGLVGRYHMSNGRIAPYGPVNSAENQELVRQTLTQSLYSTPETPQEPFSASQDRTSSLWSLGREFMPLVTKIGHDKCPFCSQNRSLYVPKDSYLAQAMGIYGHGLCRDCLTTRMDQHEYTTGQKIAKMIRMAGFRLVGADVTELAKKMLQRLYLEQNFYDPYHTPRENENETRQAQKFVDLMEYLLKEAPETYKLWPFVFRSYKKDNAGGSTAPAILWAAKTHVKDILQQATVHSERMKDDPRPEVRVPNFMAEMKPRPRDPANGLPALEGTSWDQLQNWVYEMNAQHGGEEADAQNQVVFEWPDGWTIQELHSDALAKEGEQMGHCVGGSGYCNAVDAGDTHIYSLRDPKNDPHVTFEVEGQTMYQQVNSDRTPEEENERLLQQQRDGLDPSVFQPAFSENQYQQQRRPALTAPPYPHFNRGQTEHHVADPRMEGDPDAHTAFPSWKVIQIQGKQDSEPIADYRQRIKEFITHLKENEGVDIEWHPEEAIRPGGGGYATEDYISDISDLITYHYDYEQGNYSSHDYPSVRDQHDNDEYGLPPGDFDQGLYVGRDGLEDIVTQAVKQFTEADSDGRWYRQALEFEPDEVAQALVFLVKELKIKGEPENHEYRSWDDAMNKAIQAGWQKLWDEQEEIREMNHEFEWDIMDRSWQQVKEDNEGQYDDDAEIDYDHPDMQWAQEYADKEMYGHLRRAQEFLDKLQSLWTGAKPEPATPHQMFSPSAPSAPTPDVPGALSSWFPQ